MALAEYNTGETVLGIMAYGGVGLVTGTLVDAVLPAHDPNSSDMELLIKSAAGAAAGLTIATESMRLLMPTRDNWMPPASDASTLLGLFCGMSSTRQDLALLCSRYRDFARKTIGFDEKPPVPTEQAVNVEGQSTQQ